MRRLPLPALAGAERSHSAEPLPILCTSPSGVVQIRKRSLLADNLEQPERLSIRQRFSGLPVDMRSA